MPAVVDWLLGPQLCQQKRGQGSLVAGGPGCEEGWRLGDKKTWRYWSLVMDLVVAALTVAAVLGETVLHLVLVLVDLVVLVMVGDLVAVMEVVMVMVLVVDLVVVCWCRWW